MTEPPDLMDAADDSTELCRPEPKWLRVAYTFAIEMTEPPDLMEAAFDGNELCRLEPKWLRVTYKFVIETLESKDWTNAASINEMLGLVSKWLRVTYTCEIEMNDMTEFDAVAIFENALSHDFCAVLECDLLVGDGINVAAATYRICLAMMISAPRKIGSIRKISYLKHYGCFEIDDMMINYKNTYEKSVNCVKIGILEHLTGGAEMTDPEKTKSAEHETELTNMKEYINYTKDLEGSKAHTLSDAAAFRSDLPGSVTSDKCQETIGLVTDGDKSTAEEYRKVSGSAGSLRSFKNVFQISADFPSPKNGMVGWQSALLCKQKRERTKKHVFRPFQQQRETTALGISEVAPNDEFDSNTSEGMYNDLNDGKYEKTKNVKTWTGRTITVVFSPGRVTRVMKKEIEEEQGSRRFTSSSQPEGESLRTMHR